ncbi:immunity 63 family protein [Enterobacteriaceae bacterium H4N4]|uniref:Immunity 63 family protein n=1 Tax=Silvania confinis TaxID=2926470 RepID=A0A9J6QKH0_9ENTR|nr:Imm63 family immunity protein [Silvania confinis]MCU6668789.1 immunity 63 family protein [Silvania confinis]
MLMKISDLQKQVETRIAKISFPAHAIVLHTSPVDDGTPYISFENGKYNYIISERGYEFSRQVTASSDELLYWIIYDFVHVIAVDYERAHRIPGRDSRRLYFPKIVELMGKINQSWGVKAQSHHDEIRVNSPFDDSLYP